MTSRPVAAEAIEEQLRGDNPKGRLWERCAKLGLEPPSIRHRAIGPTHQAEMTLEIGEWELSSGVQSGGARRLVEQLAARELLDELEALLADEGPERGRAAPAALAGDDDDVWEVSAEDAERLRRLNPKGLVFEWCQKRRPPVARPRFETRKAKGGGVYVRATLVTLHLSSPWFRAGQAKLAEQAAAEALLPLLPDADVEERSAVEPLDPRSALNTLRQRGLIADYSFEVAEPRSPNARFTVVGRALLTRGAIETAPMVGASKKEATLLAARALVERIGDAS